MLREHDVLRQRALELRAVILGEVVLRERPRSTGLDVVLRVLAHLVEREDATARAVDDRLVDVGRVDPRPVVEVLLLQEDREGVDLLTRRAAGHPDAGEGIGAKRGHDLVAERDVEARVPEHRRDVDREVEEEPFHAGRVVQQPVLQRGDGREPLGVDPPPDAAPE